MVLIKWTEIWAFLICEHLRDISLGPSDKCRKSATKESTKTRQRAAQLQKDYKRLVCGPSVWLNVGMWLLCVLIERRYPNLPAVSGQQQLKGGHFHVPESLVSFSPVDCLNSDRLQSARYICRLQTQQRGVTPRQLLTTHRHTHTTQKHEHEFLIWSGFPSHCWPACAAAPAGLGLRCTEGSKGGSSPASAGSSASPPDSVRPLSENLQR